MKRSQTLRVIVLEEDGRLLAQCIERDIVTSGCDMNDLHLNFLTVLGAETELGLERIPAAPAEYEAMWCAADQESQSQLPNEQQIDYRQAA